MGNKIEHSLREYPTDCTHVLFKKDIGVEIEFGIEGLGWRAIDHLWDIDTQTLNANEELLDCIFEGAWGMPHYFGATIRVKTNQSLEA